MIVKCKRYRIGRACARSRVHIQTYDARECDCSYWCTVRVGFTLYTVLIWKGGSPRSLTDGQKSFNPTLPLTTLTG